MTLSDADAFEFNNACARVLLVWQCPTFAGLGHAEIGGGCIANGHPLGASGPNLTGTLLDVLDQRGGRFGLQMMGEGGGMANARIVERLA